MDNLHQTHDFLDSRLFELVSGGVPNFCGEKWLAKTDFRGLVLAS